MAKQTRMMSSIVGGSYVGDDPRAGTAYSMNMYAESVEDKGNGYYFTSSLRSVDGERIVDTFEGGGKVRGMFTASNGKLFVAIGNSVYVVTIKDGKFFHEKIYAKLNDDPNVRVRFAETGGVNSFVVWVDGSISLCAYPVDPEKMGDTKIPAVFSTPVRVYLTADDVVNDKDDTHIRPTFVECINGSIIVNDPESNTWYFTEPYILGGTTFTRKVYDLDEDGQPRYVPNSYKVKEKEVKLTAYAKDSSGTNTGSSYLWLDRYSKPHWYTNERSADNVNAMVVLGNNLFSFGERSLNIYTQSSFTDALGNSQITFATNGYSMREIGTVGLGNTVASVSGMLFFLCSSIRGIRSVYTTRGGEPQRISTNAIERELASVSVDDAFGFGWSENGHSFYCLTVPQLKKSFVFDSSTNQWHNRSTRQLAQGYDDVWFPLFAVHAFGEIIYGGDYARFGFVDKSFLVVSDPDKYDDFKDEPIYKERVTPVFTNDLSPFILNDVALEWNVGTTSFVNDGEEFGLLDIKSEGARNPTVMLDVSLDNGYTFVNQRTSRGGQIGRYDYRTLFFGFGAGRMFVLRFTITDRVKVIVTGMKINFTPIARF